MVKLGRRERKEGRKERKEGKDLGCSKAFSVYRIIYYYVQSEKGYHYKAKISTEVRRDFYVVIIFASSFDVILLCTETSEQSASTLTYPHEGSRQ